MTVQTTSNLSNSIRAQYTATYLNRVRAKRLYDQFAHPIDNITEAQAIMGSSVVFPFISDLAPDENTISQTADVTPAILYDDTGSVTPTTRRNAIQWAENLDIQVFTDYARKRIEILADNQVESVDLLAQAAALQGPFVERAVSTRSSFDAGTPGHRCSDAIFRKVSVRLQDMAVPGWGPEALPVWGAAMHPFVFHDIQESGDVDSIGVYQDMGIHLNYELAKLGNFRLVVSANAKVFGFAGAANATAVATTLAAATNPLAESFTTAGDESADIAVGQWWIGTEETGNTFYPVNERVTVTTATTTTCSAIIGGAPNGGLKYAHALGATVSNRDSVYTVAFGGPESLVKLYAPTIGEFGEFVPPHVQGLLHQWTAAGWKFYGGYGRMTPKSVLRGEFSVSYEA